MSPEAYSKSRYSEKSDIWALGAVLYEMLTDKTLDQGLNIKDYFQKLEGQNGSPANFDRFTPVCRDLLTESLSVDADKRATIHKLKYIIDKAMIPKMKAKLNKTNSENTQNNIPSLNFIKPVQ